MTPAGGRKQRLDRLLVERGLAPTRARAQALILAGRVLSGEERLDKPGALHAPDVPLEVREGRRFVGRGALKLEAALGWFAVDPTGRDCIDVGASTGGFTQVLLLAGARRVIALDVGRGQLDWGLRNDERVIALEGINARHLEDVPLPFRPSLATIDVAFISLELVLPPVVAILDTGSPRDVVALVKPQFEVGRGRVGRGGIVRDPALHREVLERALAFVERNDWCARGLAASPIAGADGNREFLLHLRPERPWRESLPLDPGRLDALVFPLEEDRGR
jgi:23S rRNA (cytidine1920-2'-O)/16S rRNA (cytidine1409-2'-O)-methyltransferase